MVYTVILLILISANCGVNAASITNESYFRIQPHRPLFGDNVTVSCRMVAPEGFDFYRTEPEVAFDEESKLQCSPSEIGERDIEGVDNDRYSTDRNPDPDRTNISLVIKITNFSPADVGLKIACINKLHSDPNYRDEDIIISGVLVNAEAPPPPTNLRIQAPTHTPLTCQSHLSVTWDRVPDRQTDVPVQSYNVSVKVGGVTQTTSVCADNSTSYEDLDFVSYNNTVQAEVYSFNKAGISSPIVSNVMEIYRPQIASLTVLKLVYGNFDFIRLEWTFVTNNPLWILDISYELVIITRGSVNESRSTFDTTFTFTSDVTSYIFKTAQATDEMESVTLSIRKVCNQVVKYKNNSQTYTLNRTTTGSTLPNATQNTTHITTTQTALQNTTQIITTQTVTQNTTQTVTQNTTQNVTQNTTQNVRTVVSPNITQNATLATTNIVVQNVTQSVQTTHNTTKRIHLHSTHNTTNGTSENILKTFSSNYGHIWIPTSAAIIGVLLIAIVILIICCICICICWKCMCIRARRHRGGMFGGPIGV